LQICNLLDRFNYICHHIYGRGFSLEFNRVSEGTAVWLATFFVTSFFCTSEEGPRYGLLAWPQTVNNIMDMVTGITFNCYFSMLTETESEILLLVFYHFSLWARVSNVVTFTLIPIIWKLEFENVHPNSFKSNVIIIQSWSWSRTCGAVKAFTHYSVFPHTLWRSGMRIRIVFAAENAHNLLVGFAR
jgi:hypothetical protein